MEEHHQNKPVSIDKIILEKAGKAESVSDLMATVQAEHPVTDDEFLQHILNLKTQGKLVLKDELPWTSRKTIHRLFSRKLLWYWILTVINGTNVAFTFTIQENAFPTVYLRYITGSILFLVLPGYSLTKALFRNRELDFAQRAAIGLSCNIALTGLLALVLNLTPWGVQTLSVTLSLAAMTFLFSTTAFVREYLDLQRERTPQNNLSIRSSGN